MGSNLHKQSRKDFLRNFFILGIGAVASGFFIKNIISYIFPKSDEKPLHKYLIAKKNEIPKGQSKELVIGKKPVHIIHLEEGFKVFSGECTHLGCIIRWEEQEKRFYCPCHQAVFDSSGKVIDGPPPRPLDEFKVETDNNLVFIYIPYQKRGPWS